jgi:hypothetical protein
VMITIPSGSTRLTVTFLYSLPSVVLKSSASAIDAKQTIKMTNIALISQWNFYRMKPAESKPIRVPQTRSAFHPHAQRNAFRPPRCASAIQIVRPLESIAETQPQLQPALLRLFTTCGAGLLAAVHDFVLMAAPTTGLPFLLTTLSRSSLAAKAL